MLNLSVFLSILASAFLVLIYTGNFELIRIDGTTYVHTADDHMITMRVARNFSEYGVPYYNRNEAVAANTSLFWPLFLGSTIFFWGLNKAVIVNIILSCALSACTIAITTLFIKNLPLKITAAVFLAMSPTFLRYGATGWEHIPQTFLVTTAFYISYLDVQAGKGIKFTTILLLAISFLARPDSAFIIVAVGAAWIASGENYKKPRTYALGAALLAFPALYLLLMNHFYGDLAPNTAHLKNLGFWASLWSGGSYIMNPYRSGLFPAFLLTLIILRPRGFFPRLVIATCIAHLAYVLLSGGDVFPDGRFFLVMLPTLTATLLNEIDERVRPNLSQGSAIVIPSLLMISVIAWNSKNVINDIFWLHSSANIEQIRISQKVNDAMSPDEGSIGLHYLGAGYHFADFHIVDFLGKADPHIARTDVKFGPVGHNRWDYDYAFEKFDIAVIPIEQSVVSRVTTSGFNITNHDFMFWDIAAVKILSLGSYVYLPPEVFGNEDFGAFVKRELAPRFMTR